MGDNADYRNPKNTFKLTARRAPEIYDIPRIAVYQTPAKYKKARISMYDKPEEEIKKKDFLKKKSTKYENNLFIEVFELFRGDKTWKFKTEMVIPFKKSYRTGDIKKIIAGEFMNEKHEIYLFKGNSRENIETALDQVVAERINDKDETTDDLLVNMESIYFTAKVAIYDTKLRETFSIGQWTEGQESGNHEILVESKSKAHHERFVRIPLFERKDDNGDFQKTTVEFVRGFFAWKNKTLPIFVGLKLGDQYLTDNSRIIEDHERRITAFVKTPKHSLIPSAPEPLFVPPSAVVDPVTQKAEMKFNSQMASKNNAIVVRCLGMNPSFVRLPQYKPGTVDPEVMAQNPTRHPSSYKRPMVEQTFTDILQEVAVQCNVDYHFLVFYHTSDDNIYDENKVIKFDQDTSISEKQPDCPNYVTIAYGVVTNTLKSRTKSITQDWYDGLTDVENEAEAKMNAVYFGLAHTTNNANANTKLKSKSKSRNIKVKPKRTKDTSEKNDDKPADNDDENNDEENKNDETNNENDDENEDDEVEEITEE